MKKRILWWGLALFVTLLVIVFGIQESRHFILIVSNEIYIFLKHHTTAIITAFFLVNGKFIFMLFLKKILILSASGLGKRYLIEKVFNYNLKIHFLDHINADVKQLITYIKNNFQSFPIVKQIIAGFVFLGSLSFIGKFMGGMLAMKVFIAKFWSFVLALILKFSTAIIYFFTDYLWGSWIAPIIEIVIFSWFLDWLEKVPFLKKYFQKIYRFFLRLFVWIEGYLEKIFHLPIKRFFKFLAKYIQRKIYKFIGYKRISCHARLLEVRILKPNKQKKLREKREKYKEKEPKPFNMRNRLKEKREKKKTS